MNNPILALVGFKDGSIIGRVIIKDGDVRRYWDFVISDSMRASVLSNRDLICPLTDEGVIGKSGVISNQVHGCQSPASSN